MGSSRCLGYSPPCLEQTYINKSEKLQGFKLKRGNVPSIHLSILSIYLSIYLSRQRAVLRVPVPNPLHHGSALCVPPPRRRHCPRRRRQVWHRPPPGTFYLSYLSIYLSVYLSICWRYLSFLSIELTRCKLG